MPFTFRLPVLGAAVLALTLLTACGSPKLLLDANANNLRTARTITNTFYDAYGQELGLKDAPFVTVGVEGGPGYSYDVSHNVLFITPFSHADFDTQKLFSKAARDTRASAIYDELLFNFFTAHQMMHLVYDRLPLAPTTQYEEELRINTMTWLFLKEYDLMPANEAEQAELLSNLEAQLVRRFPSITNEKETASELEVLDNGSYWYVTSVSLQSSRGLADAMGTQRNYAASLNGRVAEAEASN
ncbi:MAG: hypothetical protein AB8F78_04710 [Saprospiraceae bacterium]